MSGSRCFDCGGQAPMQLGAIGFQLRFVGHRTNHRVVERIFGLPGEPDLIDELRRHQVVERLVRRPARSADSAPNREPITAAALNVRLAFGSSRSMRAAMVACNVAGTLTSASLCRRACTRRASRRSTPRSASSRTISSAKNGLPAALSVIVSPSLPTRGVRPEQLGDQCGSLRITQRRKGYRFAPRAPAPTRPRYSGR